MFTILICTCLLSVVILGVSCSEKGPSKLDKYELFRIHEDLLDLLSLINSGNVSIETIDSKAMTISSRYDAYVRTLTSDQRHLQSITQTGEAIRSIKDGINSYRSTSSHSNLLKSVERCLSLIPSPNTP